MIAFWIVAALLVAGAVLFLVPPLLRGAFDGGAVAHERANLAVLRDQLRELDADHEAGTLSDTQYAAARLELEQRVVEESAEAPRPVLAPTSSRGLLAALALAVPAIAVPLYLYLGTPEGLDPQAHAATNQSHQVTREQIETMVEQLAARLAADPDDNEGWVMLARSNNALGRYAEAARAFKTLTERLPEDAQLLADYADTLAMAEGRTLLGEPERLIARALELDGTNLKALALAGTAAFERQDYAGAIRHWERIVALVPDTTTAASMQNSIAEAQSRLGEAQAAGEVIPASTQPSVSGRVTLAPALAGRVSPTDTVFIFARPASGPKMPLAIVRKEVKDLPFDFVLDDSTAMSPDLRLSNQRSIVVGARISRSGDAKSSPGDLEGYTPAVPLGSRDLAVTIEQEVR